MEGTGSTSTQVDVRVSLQFVRGVEMSRLFFGEVERYIKKGGDHKKGSLRSLLLEPYEQIRNKKNKKSQSFEREDGRFTKGLDRYKMVEVVVESLYSVEREGRGERS